MTPTEHVDLLRDVIADERARETIAVRFTREEAQAVISAMDSECHYRLSGYRSPSHSASSVSVGRRSCHGRRRIGKQSADARKARGELPGFMLNHGKRKKAKKAKTTKAEPEFKPLSGKAD